MKTLYSVSSLPTLCYTAYAEQQWAKTIVLCSKLLGSSPSDIKTHIWALNLMGLCLLQLKEYPNALAVFLKLDIIAPHPNCKHNIEFCEENIRINNMLRDFIVDPPEEKTSPQTKKRNSIDVTSTAKNNTFFVPATSPKARKKSSLKKKPTDNPQSIWTNESFNTTEKEEQKPPTQKTPLDKKIASISSEFNKSQETKNSYLDLLFKKCHEMLEEDAKKKFKRK
jgi:hypothetical protein